jgi:mono/diheme cytochrome c family protein
LSDTGLFASIASHRPHPAAIPFDVRAPQWADGATIERFAALPGLERIVQRPQHNAGGDWTLPDGSVLVQTLSLPLAGNAGLPTRKRIESRVLVRQQGEWSGYSYRWNAEQSDAELVPSGGDAAALEIHDPAEPDKRREQTWRFPSRAECALCHSRAAGFVLAFTPLQLDRNRDYGGSVDNQLRTLEHIGLFQGQLPQGRGVKSRLVNPYEASAERQARIRSYLHVNCSSCHVKEGGGNSLMELGLMTPLSQMRLIDEPPMHDRLNIAEARLVASGSPDRSVLFQRLSRRGTGQMPPLVSTEVDRQAIELFAEWIRGLPSSSR